MNVDRIHPELREAMKRAPNLPLHNRFVLMLAKGLMKLLPVPKIGPGVTIENRQLNSAGVRIYQPEGGGNGGGLLWIHGGGYIIGRAQDDRICGALARDLGITVVSVEYRLAPGHPYPAGLDDCFEAWQWLLQSAHELGIDPARIAIAGQRAGGGRRGLDAGGMVGTVKLSPRVRAESTARDAIPSIPANAIEPFLSRPLVVEPDGLDNAPTIVATQENRVIIESGNQAYVRGMGNSKEENWFVYRRGRPLVDPDTKLTLGYEAIYLGTARVTRPGDPAIVQLTTVTQEVGTGDKLVPVGVPEVPKYAPHAPAVFMQGRVISIYGGLGQVGEAGPQAIITLNRGRSDGVEVGHVFALYRPGPVIADASKATGSAPATYKLPDERYGLAFVFRLYDRVSYALVMRISRPVNPLDVVQTP